MASIAIVISGDAVRTNYPLEQAMQAASKDGSLIAYAASFKKSLFALMSKNVATGLCPTGLQERVGAGFSRARAAKRHCPSEMAPFGARGRLKPGPDTCHC